MHHYQKQCQFPLDKRTEWTSIVKLYYQMSKIYLSFWVEDQSKPLPMLTRCSTTRLHPWSQTMPTDFVISLQPPPISFVEACWRLALGPVVLSTYALFTCCQWFSVTVLYWQLSVTHQQSWSLPWTAGGSVTPSFMVEGHVKMSVMVWIRMNTPPHTPHGLIYLNA